MPAPNDVRCTMTTYDDLADSDTRCTQVAGHEGMHDDGCLRWWDPLPREVLSKKWYELAARTDRLAEAETNGDKSDTGKRLALEIRKLAQDG
jgi:hypothetical protein